MTVVLQNCSGMQICPCSDRILTPEGWSGLHIFLVPVMDIYDVLAIWFLCLLMKVGHDLQ